MENASKVMMLGFSTIMFAAAIIIATVMYRSVNKFMERTDQHYSYMSIMVGD